MFTIKLNIVIIAVLTCFTCNAPRSVAAGSRILGLFATYSKSHMLIHCTVAEQLARVGHNVTVIGIIENVYPNATYKYMHLQLPDGGILDDTAKTTLQHAWSLRLWRIRPTARNSYMSKCKNVNLKPDKKERSGWVVEA